MNVISFCFLGALSSQTLAGDCLRDFCYERVSVHSQFRASTGDGFWQCELELSFSDGSGLSNSRGEKPRCGDVPLLRLAENFREHPVQSRLLSELGILRQSSYGMLESGIQDQRQLNCSVYFTSRSASGIKEAGEACARAAQRGPVSLGN